MSKLRIEEDLGRHLPVSCFTHRETEAHGGEVVPHSVPVLGPTSFSCDLLQTTLF